MVYNPDIHHRRSIRLPNFDYTRSGAYFVTICTWRKECLFGDVVDDEARLNGWGEIVRDCWDTLPDHCPGAETDHFIVMPNHVHGIIFLSDKNSTAGGPVGAQHAAPGLDGLVTPGFDGGAAGGRAQHAAPLRGRGSPGATNVRPGSLGAVIRSFKSAATKRINRVHPIPGAPVWQRNYYERVIRNERELAAVRQYIVDNPAKWDLDENHPSRNIPPPR